MKNFKVSHIGNQLIFKKEYSPQMVEELICANNLSGLRISDALKPYLINDFDFLKDYSFLKGLSISTRYDYNYAFLKSMPLLEFLNIQNEGEGEIDLSTQHNLKQLILQARKNVKGIVNCQNLKQIGLTEWRELDLSILKGLKNLEKVTVKTSTIKNVDILSELTSLTDLVLGNCTRLISVKGINGLPLLKNAEFNLWSKIQDYNQLTSLPSLEILKIIDCKQIPSIKFITHFPTLKQLCLLGTTDVVDGDMIPAQNLEVFYRHRQHYNIKIANERADQQTAKDLQKLKDIVNKNKTV